MVVKKCIVCGEKFEGGYNSRYCSEKCRNTEIPTPDHVGERHYELEIESAYRKKSILYAVCNCTCGEKCTVRYDCLVSGNTKSCGHLGKENQKKPLNLTGKVNQYGVKAIQMRESKRGNSYVWECECSCGKMFLSAADQFKEVKSCGCRANKNRIKNMEKSRQAYVLENTNVMNLLHKKLAKNNTSGVTGVTYRKEKGTWAAQIGFQGKLYHLGSYHRKEDAITARKTAESKMHGEFLKWYASEYPQQWEKLNKRES